MDRLSFCDVWLKFLGGFCHSSLVLCKCLYQHSGPIVISYLTIYFIAFNELYIFVITFCSQLYLLKLRSILDTKIKSLHLTFSHNLNKSPFCLFALQILYSSTCSQLKQHQFDVNQPENKGCNFMFCVPFPYPFLIYQHFVPPYSTEYVSKLWYLHLFTELFPKISPHS